MRLTLRSLAAFCENKQLVGPTLTRGRSAAWNVAGLARDVTETYACKLKDFGSQILEDGGDIDSCLGTNTHLVLCVLLQETLDPAPRFS